MTLTAVGTRYIYDFDDEAPGGRAQLGGKGLGLSQMTRMGLPVPCGFTVTTDACRAYMANGSLPADLDEQLDAAVHRLEERTGKQFGSTESPLLVSVRSGAAISMPGMMDSVLDLGLCDAGAQGLARTTGNAHFAYDSYRRLIQMYGEVVDGIDGKLFEAALSALKEAHGAAADTDLSADDLRELVEAYKTIYRDALGREFPQDARTQLRAAVEAVFHSWQNPRAQVYRQLNDIPESIGTAVNVVQMVFGNAGGQSATGVAFSRDPGTGEKVPHGEFLFDAQGEDVVAGIRAPQPLEQLDKVLPDAYAEFQSAMETLERHYRDVQDVEFTVEQGRLYILQTRSAKRTATAALRIAVEMVAEGLISREEAVLRIEPSAIDQVLHPMIDPAAVVTVAATGVPASPGAAVGTVVFDPDVAAERGKDESLILVRFDTTPDDIHGLAAATGHSHGARRHGLARGGRRARHGQALRGRLRLAADRRARRRVHDRRDRRPRRRADHRRRDERPRDHRCRAARRARLRTRISRRSSAGRMRFACSVCARTRTRRSTPSAPAPSAPRGSASAAPSTCSSARSGSRSSRR